jgi:hypothetical protein
LPLPATSFSRTGSFAVEFSFAAAAFRADDVAVAFEFMCSAGFQPAPLPPNLIFLAVHVVRNFHEHLKMAESDFVVLLAYVKTTRPPIAFLYEKTIPFEFCLPKYRIPAV